MLEFKKTTAEALREPLCVYTHSVRLVDTYWYQMILKAQLYEIWIDGSPRGFFSWLPEARALTSYTLYDPFSPWHRRVFREICGRFQPEVAYLATGDEPFLSVCMDLQTRMEAHGFFFDDSGREESPPVFPASRILPARREDFADLQKTGFYGENLEDPENPLYVLRDESGRFMGTGHIALWMKQLNCAWGAVGMYTDPAFRGQGVGRSIILAMKTFTRQMGLIPIAGCYCENTPSRRTLESCGFVTKTRYLRAYFDGSKK